jgi:erythromycin esterase
MVLICVSLSPFFAISSTQAASVENPKWHQWLQNNAQPIEKIESDKGDTYKDLNFLKKVLENKQIVFLGESSHGAAQFSTSKVRLVKYLHEKLGYNVLAFESGLGELFAVDAQINQQSSTQSLKDSMYPIWQTKEVLPLFEYIKQKSNSRQPLQLAGIDMQPVGSYGKFLESWFQKIDPKMGEKAKQTEEKFSASLLQSDTEAFQKDQQKMIEAYQELYDFTQKQVRALAGLYSNSSNMVKVTQYVLQDRIHSVKDVVPHYVSYNHYVQEKDGTHATKAYDQYNIARDQAMAKHMVWLTEELYPKQKIIVWAHNLHIRKANTKTVNPNRSPIVTLGQLLPAKIKEQSYVLGLYMNSGTSNKNDRTPLPVRHRHPKGTIESIFGKAGYKNFFIDLAQPYRLFDLAHLSRSLDFIRPSREETAWMFTKRAVLDWGGWEEQLVLREQYDGVLFLDQVNLPEYIE